MHPVKKLVRHRPRLAIAFFIGIVVALALPHPNVVTRGLIAWNVSVWTYLISMWWLMMRAGHAQVRRIAEEEDRSAVTVLAILSVASLISLAAIVLELSTIRDITGGDRLSRYAFTASTIFGSWCLVGTLFAVHYAHMFYRSPSASRPLRFPEDEQQPDYWDFLYFSFTIAVAAQTSDVIVAGRSMRKTVLAQSILSFLFNAAILGMSINIAASLVSV